VYIACNDARVVKQ